MNAFRLPIGPPSAERADAARNREHLLKVAREMISESGVRRVTMDALAERAQLGKGTVFRRFGSRAGIFAALLDDADRTFQQQVLYGPPPLGPGADVTARLVAYGRARIEFLLKHHAIERAALDRNQQVTIAAGGMSPTHIRMLLGQARREGLLNTPDIDSLAMQLAAALEGPFVIYLAPEENATANSAGRAVALADSWESLVERVLNRPGFDGDIEDPEGSGRPGCPLHRAPDAVTFQDVEQPHLRSSVRSCQEAEVIPASFTVLPSSSRSTG